jgi:hypothetical protein
MPTTLYRRTGGVWLARGRDPLGGFVAFTPGAVKPVGYLDAGSRNVGPRPGVTLTTWPGDYVLTSGEVVQGLDIQGSIATTSNLSTPATVRDCIVRGNAASANAPTPAIAIGKSFNLGGTLFEWCRFDATGHEDPFMDGLSGGNFTVRYSEILRGIDGVHATQGNVTVEACRIYRGHYFAWWSDTAGAPRSATFTDFGGNVRTAPFPAQSSGDTHSDGIQVAGSAGNVIRGNYIGGTRNTVTSSTNIDPTVAADYADMVAYDTSSEYRNAAIILNSLSTNPIGVLVEKNWLHGGQARLNLSTNGSDLAAGVTIKDNRFIRSSYGFYIFAQTGHAATLTNNVYDDDGTAVPVVLW